MSGLDIGTILEVPEKERLEVDPSPLMNDDAGFDTTSVPDGEIVYLNDGAPETTIGPDDPEQEKVDD